MSTIFTAIVLATFLFFSSVFSQPQEKRGKGVANGQKSKSISTDHIFEGRSRGILEFGLMIICGTGKNPLSYNGYGCYCGVGGKGTPLDDTDRCCKGHDECYNEVANSGMCPTSWSTYVMPYSREGCTGCKPASYYWFHGACRSALCHCDSVAVECFKKSHFNDAYKSYPKDKC